MLEKFLTVAVIVILVLFALHTNTAKNIYYQYNVDSYHRREGLLEAL